MLSVSGQNDKHLHEVIQESTGIASVLFEEDFGEFWRERERETEIETERERTYNKQNISLF